MITVKVKLTISDLWKGLEILANQRLNTKMLKFIGCVQILFGSITIISDYISKGELTTSIWPILPIGLVLIFNTKLFSYFGAKKYISTKNAITEEVTYRFSDDGYEAIGETYSGKMGWTKIYLVLEKKDYFFIYTSINAALIIPKNSFEVQQIIDFRNLIKSVPNLKNSLL